MTDEYYKVLIERFEDGKMRYFSVHGSHKNAPRYREHCLEYKVGEITRPVIPGSMLFAFSSMRAAQEFALMYSNSIICLCRAGGRVIVPKVVAADPTAELVEEYWHFFWQEGIDIQERMRCILAPKGTVMMDNLLLMPPSWFSKHWHSDMHGRNRDFNPEPYVFKKEPQ